MTITDEDLAEWRKVAKAATPGPWTTEVSVRSNGSYDAHWSIKTMDKQPEHPWSPRYIAWMTGCLRSDIHLRDIKGAKYCRECETWHLGWREVGVDVRADDRAEADAAFIATFDPPTVKHLLDELSQLRAQAAWRPDREAAIRVLYTRTNFSWSACESILDEILALPPPPQNPRKEDAG